MLTRTALPVVVMLVVATLAGAASAAAQVPTPGGPGHRPIAGWAFLGRGHELANAEVTLTTLGGRLIPGAAARTTRRGAFTLSPRAANLPRTFVINVRGGSVAGKRQSSAVSALAQKRDLDRVNYVGLASTVVREYVRSHPGTATSTATRRVRRTLGIPAWHDLDYDLYNISPRWYAASKVLRVAGARGGIGKLATTVSRSVRRDGKLRKPRFASGPRAIRAQSPNWFVDKLAGGVLSAAGGQGAGWLFNEIGFSNTPSYVSDIESQLNQLALAMSQLEDEVAAVNTAVQETYFATLSQSLTDARSAIDTAMADMAYVTGIVDDDNRAYWSNVFFTQDIVPLATNQKPWGSTRVLIDDVLVDVPPGEKPLGLQGALYIKSQDPFWTIADSQQTVQIVEFWSQYAVQALDIYLEYQHQIGAEAHCDDPPTDAGCPLQNEVDATYLLDNRALNTLVDSTGAPLKQMPSGFMVDIRSGFMWCVACYPAAMAATDAEYGLENGFYNGLCCLPFNESNTMLTLPRLQELAALMSGCNCTSSSRTGVQWLVSKAGLNPEWQSADGANTPSPGNVYVWSRDAKSCSGQCYYYTAELKSGQANQSTWSYNYTSQYYLPNRVPQANELPFYP